MTRKTIATYGPRRATVRVFAEGDLMRVQWRENGRLLTKSWPNSSVGKVEAKAWARGFADAREARKSGLMKRLTVRELWERYRDTEFPSLRENTKRIYQDCWKKWELVVDRHTIAEDVGLEHMRLFRMELEGRQKLAINTVRMAVRTVKTVFAFSEAQELIGRNRIEAFRFKVQKEKRPKAPAQFEAAEFDKILAALNPAEDGQWRGFVAIALCGYQGARQHAVLHLQWPDVDLEAGIIHWRAEWDKLGRDWKQPLREEARAALEVAVRWRTKLAYNGPWVLPAPRSKDGGPYAIQSLWWTLRAASKRAGVARLPGRAGHGFRRMLSKEVHDLTKDPLQALRAIGDTDVRQAERYVQTGAAEMARTFAELDTSKRNRTATEAAAVEAKSLQTKDAP
jgi:integrase